MFELRISDTGQYVLVEPASQTVVIHDDLQQAFDTLQARTAGSEGGKAAEAAAAPTFEMQPTSRHSLWVILGLVPLAWLLAAYIAVASLLSTWAASAGDVERLRATVDELQGEVGALRAELRGAPATDGGKAKKGQKGKKKSKAEIDEERRKKNSEKAGAASKAAPSAETGATEAGAPAAE